VTRSARLACQAAALAAVAVAAACGGGGNGLDGSAAGTAPSGDAAVDGTVTVLAAASLTEPFGELGERLAEEYPDLEVVFSFGPSSGLVEQALAGAPADILATADARTMDRAVDGGAVAGEPTIFARNRLVLIVPAGNPGEVTGLADLAREDLRIAVCAPEVPCGAAAEQLLDTAGVTASPDTLATDVKEAASLVALGEADASLVYLTDAAADGGDVENIGVPESEQVVNDYPVAVLAGAPNPEGAQLVRDAITGEPGQRILGEAGFLPGR
jgi:molybdenum ABC transporter molybdate-binding protein